ncbi:MAG: uroporphyrinogen decarboxylase family protein [bacterium]
MNERDNLLELLKGGKPERVPWLGDLTYWVGELVGRGYKPADFFQSSAYIDWHMDLGVGYYLQGYHPFKTSYQNCVVKDWRDGLKRYHQIETPKGTLRECWQSMPEDFTEGPIEHLVKTVADLPAYQYMHAHSRYEPDYTFAEQRLAQLRKTGAGALLLYLPKSPLMQMVALDAGIMALIEMQCEDPALLRETLAVVKESHDRAAQIAVDSPAEILMIPENLSAEVVGPDLFEEYMRPYQSQWASAIKQAGKYSCIHMDGTLKGLLRQECTVGLTFIEAMTPSPVGDLAVGDWADFCDNKETILWGGIPGGYFTPLVSDAEFDRHIRETLAVMRRSPQYVLGVADQVPPGALESRVRRVRELVNECGAYR